MICHCRSLFKYHSFVSKWSLRWNRSREEIGGEGSLWALPAALAGERWAFPTGGMLPTIRCLARLAIEVGQPISPFGFGLRSGASLRL